MTEKEFQQVRKELADRKRRTSFPPLPKGEWAREQREAAIGHAEYGMSRH